MKILIINAAGIGDFFEFSRFLYFIKKFRPQYTVDVIVSDRVYEYARKMKYFKNIFKLKTETDGVCLNFNALKTAWQIKNENYDLIINTFPTDDLVGDLKMYLFIKFISGFGKVESWGLKRENSLKIYSYEFILKRKENVYMRYPDILKKLEINPLSFRIPHDVLFYDKETMEKKYNWIDAKRVFFINPFSNSKERMLRSELWADIINIIGDKYRDAFFSVFNGNDNYIRSILKNVKNFKESNFYFFKDSFDDWIFLIKRSDIVLSVDSATVHIASLLNKKTFVFIPSLFPLDEVLVPFDSENIFYCSDIGEFDEKIKGFENE